MTLEEFRKAMVEAVLYHRICAPCSRCVRLVNSYSNQALARLCDDLRVVEHGTFGLGIG